MNDSGNPHKLHLPNEIWLIPTGHSGSQKLRKIFAKQLKKKLFTSDVQISSWILLLWHDQDAVHSVKQGVWWPLSNKIFLEGFCAMHIHWNLSKVQGYVKTTHSVVLDYAVDVHVLNDEDLQLSYGELGNFRWFHYLFLFQEHRSFQKLWYV